MQKLRNFVSSQWLKPKVINELKQKFTSASKFKRIFISEFLDSDFAALCANEIKQITWWKRHETEWFTQDWIRLDNKELTNQNSLRVLGDVLLGSSFRNFVSIVTGYPRIYTSSLVAHRMKVDDYVDVHNDYVPSGDRIRCILYLGSTESKLSGTFIVHGNEEKTEVLDKYPPIHNSLLIFRISPNSLHAVSKVEVGERYSLILSYKDSLIANEKNT